MERESTTVRRVESTRPTPDKQRGVLAEASTPGPVIDATAEEIHKHIVTTAVSSFRDALASVQHGLKHYKILDSVDAAESARIAEDLDNLIRRAKQHDVK